MADVGNGVTGATVARALSFTGAVVIGAPVTVPLDTGDTVVTGAVVTGEAVLTDFDTLLDLELEATATGTGLLVDLAEPFLADLDEPFLADLEAKLFGAVVYKILFLFVSETNLTFLVEELLGTIPEPESTTSDEVSDTYVLFKLLPRSFACALEESAAMMADTNRIDRRSCMMIAGNYC